MIVKDKLLKLMMSLASVLYAYNAIAAINTEQTIYDAHIKGFVQTPIGGTPGTSDLRRPNFAELKIHKTVINEQLVSMDWHGYKIELGYQRINPGSTIRLKKALRTYGQLIPANSDITTSTHFNWYRLSISKPMTITSRLQFNPVLEFAMLDFDYHFITGRLDKHRGYRHLTLRTGSHLIFHVSPALSIHIQRIMSLPLLDALNIITLQAGVGYRPFQLLILKQMQQIEFEDGQALPNHLKLNTDTFIMQHH